MSEPVRVQRKRSKGWKMPPNTVYVGRPSKWGNPYKVGSGYGSYWTYSKFQAKALYRQFVNVGYFRKAIVRELRGKNLTCWCPIGEPCHADVLLQIANKGSK